MNPHDVPGRPARTPPRGRAVPDRAQRDVLQAPDPPEVDLGLLDGFSFRCRPDCGLCCFASPVATPEEVGRLVQIEPELPWEPAASGWSRVREQGPGGACSLLTDSRCRAHEARPFPCRLYPIHVHVGRRVQASLVLSCPGVALDRLRGAPGPVPGTDGLDAEREALEKELRRAEVGNLIETARADRQAVVRRARRREGWVDGPEWFERLRARPPRPARNDLLDLDPPREEEGLDSLPAFHHPRHGIVGIAAVAGGFELLRFNPRGGVADRLGTYPGPEAIPRTSEAGALVLERYLGYLLGRDATIDTVLLEWLDVPSDRSFPEAVESDLRRSAALVLTRAVVLGQLEGRGGDLLGPQEILEGIRATDAELLDRPNVGSGL